MTEPGTADRPSSSSFSSGGSTIRLISATYGPCPGRRLFNGEVADPTSSIPYTRDVLPQLTNLLERTSTSTSNSTTQSSDSDSDAKSAGIENQNAASRETGRQRRRVAIPVMDGKTKSMNIEFGDPCPGVTKLLVVKFRFRDEPIHSICRASFREHEDVVLRRSNVFDHQDKIGTSVEVYKDMNGRGSGSNDIKHNTDEDATSSKEWRLQSASSEIILPLLLPYLQVRQRAQCSLVSKCWRSVVRDWGVASTVDVNDPSFPNFTRSFLRGIISQSYSSLSSLVLNDFTALTKEDLHPALPHLQKLKALDISRCTQLDDSTLVLVSEHLADTLEVLYIKGLQRATDEGLIAVCKCCTSLRVLEVSNVPITDKSGIAIGENLTRLEALYCRDNYQLTNDSIDCITAKCKELSLLTLWGCVRLRNLAIRNYAVPAGVNMASEPSNIVLLNLWGCHGLLDETADSIGKIPTLRSLIVAECHKLTDKFVEVLSQASSQIQHLNLRYLRQITDDSVTSIANKMHSLQSLDLSFCTRTTTASVANLLETAPSLTELRLWSCHQIDVTIPRPQDLDVQPPQNASAAARPVADGGAGRLLCAAIASRSADKGRFSFLDLRKCVGRHRHHNNVRQKDAIFVKDMEQLGFVQELDLFFSRPR